MTDIFEEVTTDAIVDDSVSAPATSELTAETLLERLVNLHRESNLIAEDIKELLAEGKDLDLATSTINAAAKLIASESYEKYREKAEAVLEILEGAGK